MNPCPFIVRCADQLYAGSIPGVPIVIMFPAFPSGTERGRTPAREALLARSRLLTEASESRRACETGREYVRTPVVAGPPATGIEFTHPHVDVGGHGVVAAVTRAGVEHLAPSDGDAVTVLIKATDVMLGK
jgi:molybdopterin-binding protein